MPHTKSEECMTLGVPFVLAVDQIISNPMAPTEYSAFYKKCLTNQVVGTITSIIFENEMLCALMCCCDLFPAFGAKKQVFQGCVKDILDEANKLKKFQMKLPSTRFLAEPDINITQIVVGRGRMNPGGPPRARGDIVKRPDVGILKTIPPADQSAITFNDFARFVEMKFPTESYNMIDHFTQLEGYASWGRPVTFIALGSSPLSSGIPGVTAWPCKCEKERKKVLEKNGVYEPQVEFEKNRTNFLRGLAIVGAAIGGPAIPLPAWGQIGRPILGLPGL